MPAFASDVALERSAAGLEQVPLTIESRGKRHAFIVEVARTAEEQALGLMNRPSLAPDRGMIFPYDPPRPAAFWMKNTLIPLDMIFVRQDGTHRQHRGEYGALVARAGTVWRAGRGGARDRRRPVGGAGYQRGRQGQLAGQTVSLRAQAQRG